MAVSITEIARLAGVSTSSVSNYFNRPERVGAVTAARIRARRRPDRLRAG